MVIQVPTGAAGGDDLLQPMQGLMRGLSILPTTDDLGKNSAGAAIRGTPESVSIIEAGGTALSKGYAVVIAALGGSAAVATGVTGFWSGEGTGVRIALTAGTAVFLAASVIAIAVIVAADVGGRAAGAVAQYDARRQIAVSVLELSLAAHGAAAAGTTQAARAGSVVWALAVAGWPAEVVREGDRSGGGPVRRAWRRRRQPSGPDHPPQRWRQGVVRPRRAGGAREHLRRRHVSRPETWRYVVTPVWSNRCRSCGEGRAPSSSRSRAAYVRYCWTASMRLPSARWISTANRKPLSRNGSAAIAAMAISSASP